MSSSSIWLHNNRLLDVMNIEQYEFTIDDFAHPLSMINRYTGNTVYPYSVAEHSVLGSLLKQVQAEGLSRAFLLHDCSEVFVNDIPRPIKRQLPEFEVLEVRVQKHIFANFNEPWENMERLKQYDSRMCQDEMLQVFADPHDIGMEPLGFKVHFWPWHVARLQFQLRAKELGLAV